MGCFNFLYKITNIFSSKRKRRVFLLLLFIILIFFVIIPNCFAAVEPENVTLSTVQNLGIASGKFTESGFTVYYFKGVPGLEYTVSSPDSYPIRLGRCSEVPAVGVDYEWVENSNSLQSFSFVCDTDEYYYFTGRTQWNANPPTVVSVPDGENLNTISYRLSDVLNQDSILQLIIDSLPMILIVLTVGFGFFVVAFFIMRLQKGRV